MAVPMEIVAFRVEGKRYEIPMLDIDAFPLKDSLINKMVQHRNDGTFGVKTTENGEIIINFHKSKDELDAIEKLNKSSKSCTADNFEKVVEIYANPKITMFELLNLDVVVKACNKITEYDSSEPEVSLTKSYEYNFIRESIYENFMSELEYYGISGLFQSKLDKEGVDPNLIAERFKAKLRKYDFKCKWIAVKEDVINWFIHNVLACGGMFSGSFLLNAALDEDWGSNSPNDLDVYANLSMFESLQCLDQHEFKSQGISRQDLIVKHLKQSFYASNAKLTELGIDGCYGFSSYITGVVRLEGVYGSELNVDFVLCTSTIPFLLTRNFDLDFCKIYYDGYTVGAVDWEPIVKKKSLDRSMTHFTRYYSANIERIEKYLKRGFIVMAPDSDD